MSTTPRRVRSPIEASVATEFATYWDTAEKSGLVDAASQRQIVASAHRFAMCFFYLSRAMATSPTPLGEHQRIFFQELASDTVHLVHTLVGGDARGGRFYLRSVIENFWRHHYFRDHVVEYGWLETRDKYFLEMKNLREHCGWLNCFQGRMKPLMTNLPRLYAELSTSVHSTSSRTLVLRSQLSEIKLTDAQGKALAKEIVATLRVCLVLCMFSEKDVFLGLHVNVQDFLRNALTAAQRTALSAALAEAGAP